MAAQHSLTIDEEAVSHYYHCIIANVPLDLPVQQLAELITPLASSPHVLALASLGCRPVPHKLHAYKERLATKFGFVTYFIHHQHDGSRNDAAIHEHVLRWLAEDVPTALAAKGSAVTVRLAQPPDCFTAGPFLKELNRACAFLAPPFARDPKKLETFVLTRLRFLPPPAPAAAEEPQRVPSSPEDPNAPWPRVGTFDAALSAADVAWLATQHTGFAALSSTDQGTVSAFFRAGLKPLVSCEP